MAFCIQPAVYADSDLVQNSQPEVKKDAFEDNNEARALERKTFNLSPVERVFNTEDALETGIYIKQAGYDVFNSSALTGGTGKYDNSYKLSIGEKVTIYFYGASLDVMAISGSNVVNAVTKGEVDSKGCIYVQGVGLVNAENRTVQEVENSINAMASRKYKDLKAKVSVSSSQDFSVFVYGNVNKPGKVSIGNNSSIMDALSAAGGVKKTGTLRNIKYTSNKKTQTVDLYKAIFQGNDSNIILRPNDKIFVDKIGKVVAFKNGVNVPGIYEVKGEENLQQIATQYAGGLSPLAQSTTITLTRLDSSSNQRSAVDVAWKMAKSTVIQNGDTVEFRKLFNSAENTVTIQGNIKHPATYAYKKGMRLSDILKSEDELLEETFINQAVIRRISGLDNQIETIPVFLKEFFAGMNDPYLQPRDIVTIYKSTNSSFVDVYGCINKPKHMTYHPGMVLNDVIMDVKFLQSAVTENDKEVPVAQKTAVQDGNKPLETKTNNSNTLIPAENVAVEITHKNGATSLYYLYDIMINSEKIKSITINPEDKVFFRTLRDNEVLKVVKISGFVNNPGTYRFVEGKTLKDIIETAGGLSPNADLRGIVYKRASLRAKQMSLASKNNKNDIRLLKGRLAGGYKESAADKQVKLDMIENIEEIGQESLQDYNGQIALSIKSNDLDKLSDEDNLVVQDGDDIHIPRMSTYVSVIGEVYNEQAFVYKKGAKAKYYIKKVGGYTPNANKFRAYKIGVNGKAVKLHTRTAIEAGDTIVVPRKISGGAGETWTNISAGLQSVASLFVMIFGITKW